MDPYLELNISENASDEEVRSAYLELVKRYTPNQSPDTFARIARAYGMIDTPQKRVRHRALGEGDRCQQIENLVEYNLDLFRIHRPRPKWEDLCAHFGASSKNK